MKNKKHIKDYRSFEAISGMELVGKHMGPGYPEQDTEKMPGLRILYSERFGGMYTEDDYQDLYNDYLTKGGKPLDGFNLRNLDIVLSVLKEDPY